jgi:hypothetical protein
MGVVVGTVMPLVLIFFLQGCVSSSKMTIAATASLLEDIVAATNKQSDLRIVQQGTPAYLMLLDGMVESWPENERILLAAAQGYASYASVFIEDDDQAHANLLYGRAKVYALQALDTRGLKQPRKSRFDQFEERLAKTNAGDVPYLFWSASIWGSWISLNRDSMAAIAELPRVERMMNRVLELDEGFHYGGPHLFMGIWYASRPAMAGGDLKRSQQHFQRAVELGKGQFLMAYIYYAENYAKNARDKKLYISLLQQVLDSPVDAVAELTLSNSVAQRKARQMLETVDEHIWQD